MNDTCWGRGQGWGRGNKGLVEGNVDLLTVSLKMHQMNLSCPTRGGGTRL